MTPGAEAILSIGMWLIGGLLSLIVVLIGSMAGMTLYRSRKAEGRIEKLAEIFESRMIAFGNSLEKAVMESLDDRHALRVMLASHEQLIVGHARELEMTHKRLNSHGDTLREHSQELVKHDMRIGTVEKRS